MLLGNIYLAEMRTSRTAAAFTLMHRKLPKTRCWAYLIHLHRHVFKVPSLGQGTADLPVYDHVTCLDKWTHAFGLCLSFQPVESVQLALTNLEHTSMQYIERCRRFQIKFQQAVKCLAEIGRVYFLS